MLSLDQRSIDEWLRREIGQQIAASSRLEEDGLPSVVLALDRLAERMSARQQSNQAAFQAWLLQPETQAGLRTLLAHLSDGRRLLILCWLAEVSASDRHAIMTALMDDAASPPGLGSVLRETVRRFHSRVELGRITSQERIDRVLAICTEEMV